MDVFPRGLCDGGGLLLEFCRSERRIVISDIQSSEQAPLTHLNASWTLGALLFVSSSAEAFLMNSTLGNEISTFGMSGLDFKSVQYVRAERSMPVNMN